MEGNIPSVQGKGDAKLSDNSITCTELLPATTVKFHFSSSTGENTFSIL